MKHLGRICATFLLSMLFAVPALGGDMHTPGYSTPPPSTQSVAPTGDEEEFSDVDAAEVIFTDVVWNSIKTAFSIF
ncbi:MAG TPA: hypothetical protein VGB73_15110 [Pyrinomonadaceae bacterium]